MNQGFDPLAFLYPFPTSIIQNCANKGKNKWSDKRDMQETLTFPSLILTFPVTLSGQRT